MSLRLRSFLMMGLLALVSGLAVSPQAEAQQQGGATVRGTVVDPDSALVGSATVTLTPASGKALTAVSGNDGAYIFRGVPAGTYSLTATATGFATFAKLGIRIAAGAALTQDIKMLLEEQSQVVQVTAQTAQVSVDSDSNASMTVIKGKDLEALSDDPDELSSELSALAGPAAGPNGGQIYVDGFTGGQLPPKSSIREIRINQNPFSAQYDKIGFGRVEVFTKPGTDKFHGNASVQGNASQFNSTNPFEGAPIPYHTIFFLGQLTGPINKKASFTLGGSHRTIQDNEIVNPNGFYATSPTDTVPCQPGVTTCTFFPGYPSSARAVFFPQTRWDINPRVDLAISDKNTLTTRYQYESNSSQNGGLGSTSLPTLAVNSSSSEQEVQISDSQIVSSKIVNETRFEYQASKSSSTPQYTGTTLSVQGAFTAGGAGGGGSSSTGSHIEVQNYTSIALAKNFIRFGGRVRYNSDNLTSQGGTTGTFTYAQLLDPCVSGSGASGAIPSGCVATTVPCSTANTTGGTYQSSYQCGLASQYNITTINKALISGSETDLGLYVEDDWKPKGNLSISYGMRLETESVISSSHDFAPRASISYGIPRKGGNPLTVLRGGFGIFYDRFNLGNIISTYQNNGTNQVTAIYLNPGLACKPGSTASCGTGTVSRSNIQTLAPDLRSSYNMQAGLGVDQQVGRSATVSMNYLHTRGLHQFLSRSLQSGPGYDYQYGSGGVFNQDQLTTNLNLRMKYGTIFGFYALSFAKSDTSGAGTFLTNASNPYVDYGRAAFNRRSMAVFGGSATLPFKISASPFLITQTGSPYNVTAGRDLNGDSIYNDRPAFAAGSSGDCRNASTFTTAGASADPIPINYCTGPGFFVLNMRLARTFGFGPLSDAARARAANAQAGQGPGGRMGGMGGMGGGPGGGGGGGGRGGGGGGGGMGGGGGNSGRKYNLTFGLQGSNIFNIVPLATPSGSLASSKFGQSTTTGGPFGGGGSAVRKITLQATFNF